MRSFLRIYAHAAPQCVARGWRKHLPGNVDQAFLDRQVFMNAFRSGPFLPVACLAHSRILSCCEILAGVAAGAAAVATFCSLAGRGLTADASSAAATGAATPIRAAKVRAYSVFMSISIDVGWTCGWTETFSAQGH